MTQNLHIFIKIFVVILLFFIVEEYYSSNIYNYYLSSTFFESNSTFSAPESKPAILVVIGREQDLNNYELAQSTLKCYSKIFGYQLFQIIMDSSPEFQAKCPQKDFMFQRHCVTINILKQNPEIRYLMFLDADMGVINPLHLIEDYIDPNVDLIFYERIFNYEIMAGSYIVKNTEYAINFLQDWVNYETQLPNASWHGTDNAAIHQIFVDHFRPNNTKTPKCRKIWERSKDWGGVWNYVGCVRSILNDTLNFDRIKIVPKGSHQAWVRDGWLTGSEWASRDFIFHAWKTLTMNYGGFASWSNPFVPNSSFPISSCTMPHGLANWKYNYSFIREDSNIDLRISKLALQLRKQYLKLVSMQRFPV